jgi:hypothetical protein
MAWRYLQNGRIFRVVRKTGRESATCNLPELQETKSNSCFFPHRLGLSFSGRRQENALGRNGSAGGSGGRTESLEGQSAQPPNRAETILQSLFLRGLERTPPNRQPIGPEANGDPVSHLVQILQLIALRRISNDKRATGLGQTGCKGTRIER